MAVVSVLGHCGQASNTAFSYFSSPSQSTPRFLPASCLSPPPRCTTVWLQPSLYLYRFPLPTRKRALPSPLPHIDRVRAFPLRFLLYHILLWCWLDYAPTTARPASYGAHQHALPTRGNLRFDHFADLTTRHTHDAAACAYPRFAGTRGTVCCV